MQCLRQKIQDLRFKNIAREILFDTMKLHFDKSFGFAFSKANRCGQSPTVFYSIVRLSLIIILSGRSNFSTGMLSAIKKKKQKSTVFLTECFSVYVS